MDSTDVKTQLQSVENLSDTYIGTRTSALGIDEHISIDDTARLTHVLTIGPTGYGKSQLMTHAALQDAEKGHGLCIINPKGDMIDEFLAKLPADREDDVIYINPNRRRVPAINVLEPYVTPDMTQAERDLQKDIILSDITDVFRRLSKNWGDRWGANLRTLLRAHLHLNLTRNAHKTLMDVFQCVINDDALLELMNAVNKPVLYEELQQIHALSDKEMEPLQRRFRDFLESETIRRLITQEESDINFREILDEQKILLVDVQKGKLGTTTATLIGSIIITKVWAAAQSRITIPEDERTPFFMHVDELHSFSGEGSNFAKILSEAREYKLGTYLSTQYLNQLERNMRRAVSNNCRTKVFFSPSGSEDVAQITGMLQGIDRDQLTALGKYRAAVQRPATGEHMPAVIFDTYPPWDADHGRAEDLKQRALADYPPLRDRSHAVAGQKGGASDVVGKEAHGELLKAAHEHFSAEGYTVNILHQEPGAAKPDAHLITDDGDRIHVEAESQTVTSPAKILQNAQKAADQERDLVFVVARGSGMKLANILDDPVNRRGTDKEDEQGTFSYYRLDGEPCTATDCVDAVEYTIYEHVNDGLQRFDQETEAECPELENAASADLQEFCLYRDPSDGHCSKLGIECVLE